MAWSFVQTSSSAATDKLRDHQQAQEQAQEQGSDRVDFEACVGAPIAVRNTEDAPLAARCSSQGPVVAEHLLPTVRANLEAAQSPAQRAVLRSDALEQPLSLSFLRDICTASDFASFSAGVGELQATALRFVYADKAGNIGSVNSGR